MGYRNIRTFSNFLKILLGDSLINLFNAFSSWEILFGYFRSFCKPTTVTVGNYKLFNL